MRKRLFFIGGGINSAAGAAHFAASQLDKRFEVIGGCFSRDKTVNLDTAERWGIPRSNVFYSVDSLIENCDPVLDTVAVLTPTPSHFFTIQSLISAGFTVISEKSLTTCSQDAIQLTHDANARSLKIYCVYNYTGYPMVREARALINAGLLGKISHCRVEMPQEGYVRVTDGGKFTPPQHWRTVDGIIPTISLDLGIHLHQLVEFLLNTSPTSVTGSETSNSPHLDVIDNVFALAACPNDIEVSFWYSKSSAGFRNGLSFEVYGELGSLSWVQTNPEHLLHCDNRGGRHEIDRASPLVSIANNERYTRFKVGHPAGFIEAFANQYADIATILDSPNTKPSAEYVFDSTTATRGLQFLEAIHQASVTGSRTVL